MGRPMRKKSTARGPYKMSRATIRKIVSAYQLPISEEQLANPPLEDLRQRVLDARDAELTLCGLAV